MTLKLGMLPGPSRAFKPYPSRSEERVNWGQGPANDYPGIIRRRDGFMTACLGKKVIPTITTEVGKGILHGWESISSLIFQFSWVSRRFFSLNGFLSAECSAFRGALLSRLFVRLLLLFRDDGFNKVVGERFTSVGLVLSLMRKFGEDEK